MNVTRHDDDLRTIFSNYKAEWLSEELFDLFIEPNYFPEISTSKPCFLVGARGTGKTTVLKSLSYQGRYSLAKGNFQNCEQINEWPYIGIYYRINTNRVTAFKGDELDENSWIRFFAHYFNLNICLMITDFLIWFNDTFGDKICIDNDSLEMLHTSLNIEFEPCSITKFRKKLKLSFLKFESSINNIIDSSSESMKLTMQGAPIDEYINILNATPPFKGKKFCFLIDEYENLLDYQQKILNTLVKHCEKYSFKIGVKELGLRQRATLNPNEQLIDPADFKKIDILEKLGSRFPSFASKVCELRLKKGGISFPDNQKFEDLFDSLSIEDEALKLGLMSKENSIDVFFSKPEFEPFTSWIDSLSLYERYVLKESLEHERYSTKKLTDFKNTENKWFDFYNNHKFAFLFTLKKGKRGTSKLYCGWNTFCKLSGDNIRFMFQLLDSTFFEHFESGNTTLTFSAETQTKAAINTGEKNIKELEGLTIYGAKLTKLTLSLGRIFGIMAQNPIGHSPEVVQFYLDDKHPTRFLDESINDILTQAIMQVALIRNKGNKLQNDSDIKEYDYSLHPIFTPYFGFSYRKKRKFKISQDDFLGLIKDHKNTIMKILKQNNRPVDSELPDQLKLFEGFYERNN